MYRSDPVQRTNQKPLPIFEILNLESNCSKYLSKCFLHSSSAAYCIFEHRRKDYCCFTSHLLHSNLLVQSTRFPNCWHARTGPWHCRPTGHMHPRTRLSASGKFLAATVLCSSDTDPADQHCRAEQDTTGSQDAAIRMQDDCIQDDCSVCAAGAAHSVISIFRSAAKMALTAGISWRIPV